MNGKNIYSGNINTPPTHVTNNQNDLRQENQKYVATIVSENLRRNSIDLGDQNKKINLKEIEKQKNKEKNDNSKDKKVSKKSEELLKMSVDYNDYDFNEWNKKIVDTYNPYAIDDLSNSSLSNYEKIKRIMAQEARYENNFNKFVDNLENIYDDIKEKITNETLKIMYGEDNFEYIPNAVETYRENWTTGDEEADLLLKIYHSPKIKQRDISAQDYIAQKYNEFYKTIDGKQSFEVSSAKTGVNPNDVVRVHLDKAYYMDDVSIAKNKNEQDLYTKTILEKNGGNKNSTLNRFGNNKPTPPRPTNRPTPSQTPIQQSQEFNNENNNLFVPTNDENQENIISSSNNRVVPRREEWISAKHNEQLFERNNAEIKWDKLKELNNSKLEELIIENGLDIIDINYNFDDKKQIVVLSSIIFDDEIKESSKIKELQKFAKRNKYNLDIANDVETKAQTITYSFDVEKPILQGKENYNFSDYIVNNENKEKITNLEELVSNSINIDKEIYNIDNLQKDTNENSDDLINSNDIITPINDIDKTNNNNTFIPFKRITENDNISGIGGMDRMSYNNKPIDKKHQKTTSKSANLELVNEDKIKSLADVLAEKRNKNHQQMNKARINKKVSLQEAIDNFNKEHSTDHGPKKKQTK